MRRESSGHAPPVDTANSKSPRLTLAGTVKSLSSNGGAAILTSAPIAFAAQDACRFTSGSSVAQTTNEAPCSSAAENRFGAAGGHTGRSVREILLDIVDTPISPELTPSDASGAIAQKTEDLVGPYELHDFFLYHFFRFGTSPAKLYFLARKAFAGKYDEETLQKWLRKFYWRFFSQQFKRSALPDGPKVGSVSLSPRGDWRMPSDAKSSLFLAELDTL